MRTKLIAAAAVVVMSVAGAGSVASAATTSHRHQRGAIARQAAERQSESRDHDRDARSTRGSVKREAERSITGRALARASAAALARTGQGRVTDTEVGDEDGYCEVEVTRNDGRQVDVHLDRNLRVLSVVPDREARPGR